MREHVGGDRLWTGETDWTSILIAYSQTNNNIWYGPDIWGSILASWRWEDSQLTADCWTGRSLLGTGVNCGTGKSLQWDSITTVV